MWKGREIPAWYLKGTKKSSCDKLLPLKQLSSEQQQQHQQQHSSSMTSVASCENPSMVRGRSVEIDDNNRLNQNNTLNDNDSSGVTVGENDSRHNLTVKDSSSGEKRGKYKKSKKACNAQNLPHKPSVINNPVNDQTGARSPSASSSEGSPEKCNSSGDSVRGQPGIRPRPSFSPAVPPIVMVS